MNKSDDSPLRNIIAFGFNEERFYHEEGIKIKNGYSMNLIRKLREGDSKGRRTFKLDLKNVEGLILPSGIFETIYGNKKTNTYSEFHYDEEMLLEIENLLTTFLKQDKWVCFLVSKPIYWTLINSTSGELLDVSKTDLAKKMLIKNRITVNEYEKFSSSDFKFKYDVFGNYKKKYGVAKNKFQIDEGEENEINWLTDERVALEVSRKQFFLPFQSISKEDESLLDAIYEVSRAITSYKLERSQEVPDWLKKISFQQEELLKKKKQELEEGIQAVENQLASWNSYKQILTTKNDILSNKVAAFLENFFGLEIDSTDVGIEDLKVMSEGKLVALIEVKGVNGGIQRQQINQLDSHRERNGLPPETPAVLIINPQMRSKSLEHRRNTTVAHISHAESQNILIVRTIDLLDFAKEIETFNIEKRREILLEKFTTGKGIFDELS